MSLPFGSFAFNIGGGSNGFTAPMSIIVDKDVGSFTYYKQNNSGKWTNITKAVTLIGNGKAKIDFDLTDGGVFDRDGIANGTIVDPGGVATNKLNPYVIEGETLVGDVSFVEDSTSFMGTLAYNITGGKDKELFTLNSTTGELSFKNAPVYSTTSSNAYIVEVTASGTTSGSEARAITVTVLNSDGANTVTPIVIGACGSSNRLNLLTAPTSNLCQSGIASSVTQANNLFNWSCNSEDVAVVNCSANKVLPVVISDNSSGVSSNTTTTDTEYTTTVTDSSTNSVQATKFISGDKKAEHIAKANGVAVSTATSYVEGTQINVKSSGDVETTVEMLDDSNSTVSIKVEGKVTGDEKAVHSLSVGGKETKATSKVNGTTTTISAVGEVETKATVGAKEIIAQAFADGKATHIIKIGNVESKATIEFAGAQTVMENDGSVKTSVDETQTIGGNPVTVKSVVATDNQGETQTWFEDSNGNTLERTVSQSTPLESGATIDVANDSNGKLQFKIVTPVTREIVIE
ncbi:MAG: hypothetical protein PHF17_04710 [Arcobacteraceae bacterium]|nr:hypothetical protein [Arcobacteraceae bacterium]